MTGRGISVVLDQAVASSPGLSGNLEIDGVAQKTIGVAWTSPAATPSETTVPRLFLC